MRLRAGYVRLDVVADHPGEARIRVERVEGGLEVGGRWFAEDDRLGVRRVLEPGDECARIQQRSVLRLPPAILVKAIQIGARLELVKGTREVHVAEDEVR